MKKVFISIRAAAAYTIWPVLFPCRIGLSALSFQLPVACSRLSVRQSAKYRVLATNNWQLKRIPLLSLPILCTIIYAFILANGLNAQTYAINNDLQNINMAMFETKNLYMEIDYNLYFDQTIRSQMKGIVKKNDRNLFQQVGNITVVKNNDYSVFVHNDQKLLVVDPNPELKDPIKKEDILRINIDTLKSWLLGSELTEKNGSRFLTFTLKGGEYSRIIIEYDPVSYFIRRMEMHARDTYKSVDNQQASVWMEVIFSNTNTSLSFPEEEFSEKKYVSIKNKEVINVSSNYKKYRLINNLPKSISYDKK